MAYDIIDTPQPVQRYLRRLGDITTIIRYITSVAPNSDKHVKIAEIKAIKAAGKKVGLVHEGWGDFKHAGHGGISAADGARDGAYARRILPKLGAPAGAAVYFAVDCDASPSQIKTLVLPYFKAVATAFADAEYRVGVYGPGSVCDAVISAGYADLGWLSNAKGWSGYAKFKPKAAIVQIKQTKIAGNLDVDPNVAVSEDWGQFEPFADDAEITGDQEDVTAAVTDEDDEEDTPRLAQGNSTTSDVVTGIAATASMGGVTRYFGQARSLIKSKIAWLTGGLGGTGATVSATSDPDTSHLIATLAEKPMFWVAIACLVIAGFIVYYRWRDHGKGSE